MVGKIGSGVNQVVDLFLKNGTELNVSWVKLAWDHVRWNVLDDHVLHVVVAVRQSLSSKSGSKGGHIVLAVGHDLAWGHNQVRWERSTKVVAESLLLVALQLAADEVLETVSKFVLSGWETEVRGQIRWDKVRWDQAGSWESVVAAG